MCKISNIYRLKSFKDLKKIKFKENLQILLSYVIKILHNNKKYMKFIQSEIFP